jgi:hypothetical protein
MHLRLIDGSLGIGTNSPASKLQVQYTTTSNGSAAIAEFGELQELVLLQVQLTKLLLVVQVFQIILEYKFFQIQLLVKEFFLLQMVEVQMIIGEG